MKTRRPITLTREAAIQSIRGAQISGHDVARITKLQKALAKLDAGASVARFTHRKRQYEIVEG